ncbi:MAG: GntR family transcriptional regulator [Ruminococcus sp.]|nr:GntR family transcriptional regulator [Ruminococcus sp.]
MELKFDSEKPIFQQLADWISDNIIRGAFAEESRIPSTTEISVTYKVNPATALKAVNILVDKGVIYKKRGLGMYVAEGACKTLIKERQEEFFDTYVKAMLNEAEKLGLTKEDIVEMIERGNTK